MRLFPLLNKIKHRVSAQRLRVGSWGEGGGYDPIFKIISRERANICTDYFLALSLFFLILHLLHRLFLLLISGRINPPPP